MLNPTTRFSSRVENYIKYRPGYPGAVIDLLATKCGLASESVIADIGSGTGILTELFLKHGNPVIGVEPNREMRDAAERLLAKYPRFTSIDGTAEATTLQANSIDFVTAGQAFHWFNREKAHAEFIRFLKPGGWVVLIWNDRQVDTHPFLAAYENLLKTYGTDYETVGHKHVETDDVRAFFGDGNFDRAVFPSSQHFDFEGLRGRLMSSSYAPEPGHPKHQPMLNALHEIFNRHQVDGKVAFEYNTTAYFGQLNDQS